MWINKTRQIAGTPTQDDRPLFIYRRDMSGGINTRQSAQQIQENQGTVFENVDLSVPGQRTKRKGSSLIGNNVGSNPCKHAHSFIIDGATDTIVMFEGTTMWSRTSESGDWDQQKNDYTDTTYVNSINAKMSGISPDDVMIVQNDTDNAYMVQSNLSTVTDLLDDTYSIPKTLAMAWYNNRVWALDNDNLYYSLAYPTSYAPDHAQIIGDSNSFAGVAGQFLKVTVDGTDYDNITMQSLVSVSEVQSAINNVIAGTLASVNGDGYLVLTSKKYGLSSSIAIADGSLMSSSCVGQLFASADTSDTGYAPFDRVSQAFRIPVGEERAIVPTRDLGMIVMGQDAVWAFNPSQTPSATDQPVPITTDEGCAAGKTAVVVADDVYYLAQSGVRALKRTEQDKLQMHSSVPVSYPNKDEYELINWTYIKKATAVYFDNMYLIALPTSSSSTNNKVWVYYPATNGWATITGWNVGDWVKHKINGEERLYYADANNGVMYRVFTGYDDNGSAFTMTEEGREEDFGQPLVWKKGGTVEVEAKGTGGTYTIAVHASLDGESYSQLGVVTLYSESSPRLPIALPFSLGGAVTARDKFPIDSLGRFRTIKIKLVNTDLNSGEIKILGHSITTYPEEYQNV